ncbi:MAG: metalloregulator ArsR/SmtB family transcription factor, partial [Candidatus Omnitrophica bacterium]|nr:metalloregulator ArsR/SmtB family transcription factor [Candidatus Omnitrophota bacterium]
ELLKALAHPVRLRMVEGLIGHECNVDRIMKALKIPQSTASQHLALLKAREIVQCKKDGVKTCYRVVDRTVIKLMDVLKTALSLALLILVAGSVTADAEGSGEITLETFCAKVSAYYPELKRQSSEIARAGAQRALAVSGFFPKIKGTTSMTTSDDQVYVFGTLLRQRGFTADDFSLSRLNDPASRTNYDMGISGEMPLFDSLNTIYKVKQAKHMEGAARHDEAFQRMEAVLIAADVYLNTLAMERTFEIVNNVCEASVEDIKQAEGLKDKGMVLGADFYAAKVIMGGLVNRRNELKGRIESMHALMNILMGEDPALPVKLIDDPVAGSGGSKELKAWLDEAYKSRPDLFSIEERIQARGAELSRERSSLLPNISAFGDLRENTHDFDRTGGSFAVGIKGSVDIFDLSYFSRVKIAKEELKKLEYERTIARDAIARDINGEYSKARALSANIPVLKEMADDSARALELTIPLYREARKSIADLLEIRQSYVKTFEARFQAVSGLMVSRARLLFLAGELDAETVEQSIGE